MTLKVFCPAKINRFLSVGPLDRTGYHPLRTIFQAVGLYDILIVRKANENSFRCESPEVPVRNTVTRAQAMTGEIWQDFKTEIYLQKHIPSEAGLGGGSSDAAGYLRAAMRFLNQPLSQEVLDAAAAVGADVPFFLYGGHARATGYGDQIQPLPDRDREWLVLIKPEEGVSTPSAYRALDESPRTWREFPEGDELYNDFERVAPCICGEIAERMRVYGAKGSLLAGSGSVVFGVFSHEDEAREASEQLVKEFQLPHWLAPTLSRQESLRMEVIE